MTGGRSWRTVSAGGGVVGLLALFVVAQASGQAGQGRGGGDNRREEVFRMVDAYLAMNMEEALDLSPEQSAKVLPLVKRLQVDRRRFMERKMEAIRELKRSLGSGSATEGQITGLMTEIRAMEREEPLVLAKDRDAIDGVLTVLQQAQYRVLESEVEHRIRGLLRRPGGPRGR